MSVQKLMALGLLVSYLGEFSIICQHGTDDGWEKLSDLKIQGGAWAKGSDSVTHGIWLWNEPFILNGVSSNGNTLNKICFSQNKQGIDSHLSTIIAIIALFLLPLDTLCRFKSKDLKHYLFVSAFTFLSYTNLCHLV